MTVIDQDEPNKLKIFIFKEFLNYAVEVPFLLKMLCNLLKGTV